jgi:hypothetical protein
VPFPAHEFRSGEPRRLPGVDLASFFSDLLVEQLSTYEATAVKGVKVPVPVVRSAAGASVEDVRVGHRQMHGC